MGEYTCYANKSAWYDTDNPNVNHSTETSLSIKAADGSEKHLACMGFDLSAINGMAVSAIEFYYYVLAKDASLNSESKPLILRVLSSSWEEDQITAATGFGGSTNFTEHAMPAANTYGTANISIGHINDLRQYGLLLFLPYYVSGGSTVTSSRAASNKPYLKITAAYPKPTATPDAPISVLVSGDSDNTFSWSYANGNGDIQKSFALQFSTDGTSWTDLVSATSATTSVIIPAGTLPAGTVHWRVKVVSEYDVESDWSAAAIVIVQAASPAPLITAINTVPRPTIKWQSTGQQGYQVQTDGYDSGTVYGTAKQHTIPEFLANGAHEVSVRVQNSFSLWSDWSTISTTVANTPGTAVVLSAQPTANGVILQWTGAHDNYIIYRDGIKIAETTETTYTDWLTIGAHNYTVRGVTGDYYAMSSSVSGTPTVNEAAICVLGVHEWLPLKMRRGSMPSLDISETEQIVYQHYSGREKPIAETNGFYDSSYNFSFSFLTKTDADKLRSMRGKTVIYKDAREMCVGVLQTNTAVDKFSWDVSGTIVEVDYAQD